MRLIEKPKEGEYPAYAIQYIKLLPDDGKLLLHLRDNFIATKKLVASLPEDKLLHRYAPGKWTIKEILVHIIDDERIYGYRALRYARNDKTVLPGFDQDEYTQFAQANERGINNILQEFEAVRQSTIGLFNGIPEESLLRTGFADNKHNSVRAMGYHIAGHELHHVNIIKQKYL